MDQTKVSSSAPLLILALVCGAAGCGAPVAPSGTALAGTVVRGPIQPVCQIASPCEAPFSATFTVKRTGHTVAAFRSDSDGHFDVPLAPGMYTVVPDADAPVMSPGVQSKDVVVGSAGTTTVLLHFDTGIR
jgi:hypothetical protein